ncbi:MAG: hypothetical protein ABIJ05_01055 [Patescibacteria group bacterium]
MLDILKSKEFKSHLWIACLLLLAFLLPNPWKFVFMLLSGITSGLYYGCYNDIIWRPNPETDLSKHPHYRAHQMWVHIFCGLAASIALYFLTTLINFNNLGLSIKKYGFELLILSFIVVMGYIGLLPRFLWFTSYGLGQFGRPPGK